MKIQSKPQKRGEIKKVIPKDVGGIFSHFATTLEKTDFNLDIFYKNIKKVNLVKATKKQMDKCNNVAQYDIMSNTIMYLDKYFKTAIFHELFHLASTIIGKRIVYSGFFQMDMKTKSYVGLGLSEGYSAILDERYFGDVTKDRQEILGNSYYVVKYFVQMIEEAIGKDTMEEWYSTCDLETLTTTLAYATDYESTLKFYECLDNICLYLESKKFCRRKIKTILESYEYAALYVARVYLDVIEHAYIDETLSDNDYEDFLYMLKDQLSHPMIVGKRIKYQSQVVSDEDFDALVKDTMKKV